MVIVNLDSNGGDYWKVVLVDKIVKIFFVIDYNVDFYLCDVWLNVFGIVSFILVILVGEVGVELGIMG